MSMTDSPDPVIVGGNLTYTVFLGNSGAFAANNVVVTDTLPPNVNLISVTASQGSCSGISVLNCNIGTLGPSANAVITIIVTPTAEGIVSDTANVTTSSFDPINTDNSATSVTTVGSAVTGIQAQINAAADGDTILVPPGTYTGGLNFNGKNITLQSTAGPASTIIHGNQDVAVRMGPGGAIKGFTITGGLSGIRLTGQGSLISGNVFDGNSQIPGGFGAGIDGNSASPIIERNIFRNNSCPNQLISGVVAFFNGSSPLIVNNIFENNQCRGINLTLPQGNTPQVVNNTFVGNGAAIRVDRRVPQTTQIFRNNVIVQNGIGLEIEFGTDSDNPVWGNNLVFGNTVDYQGTASQTGINGNISANPMFIDGAAGNYRIQTGSPAIDAGSPIGAPGVDFDGISRPIDGNGDAVPVVDTGAFEAH
jgi:serine protease